MRSPAPARSTTLAADLYEVIRAELLRGEPAPGSKLRLNQFSIRFGVSLSVVREAMTRLAEQGLVVASPQRGFSVMPLTEADLVDLTHARVLIESLALRESITHGELEWESSVIAATHTLQRTPPFDDDGHVNQEWARVHREFHRVLLAGGPSRRLMDAANNLRDHSDLYLHWSTEFGHDVGRDVAAEHQEISDLAVGRKADAAAASLEAHIKRTTSGLLSYVRSESATLMH